MCHLCQQKYAAMRAGNISPQADQAQHPSVALPSEDNPAGRSAPDTKPEVSITNAENG